MNPRPHWSAARGIAAAASVALACSFGAQPAGAATANARHSANQLTYHGNAQRTGWHDGESRLTPANVRSGTFGLLWESAPLGNAGATPPRLFASPLYLEHVPIDAGGRRTRRHEVVFAASTTGYVAAINATPRSGVAAGATLWSRQISAAPCLRGTQGILGTPVIDMTRSRLYVVACEAGSGWHVHALALRDGREAPGWPLPLAAEAINAPGINMNGGNAFPRGVANLQRGALNLSADGTRLFVTFGGEPVSGWLLAIDTRRVRVASAFSMTARTEEGVGGLWSSGGAALDRDGNVYAASGSSVINALAGKGAAGVYPDSDGNWGQSIVQLGFDREGRFRLAGTYTPFDYCESGGQDIDIGSGTPILVDLPARSTATPRLLVHGGSKQGNAYLLERDHLPGSLARRAPCSTDSTRDGSLLAPEAQPQFGARGPLNVFGPYSAHFGMGDLAKSRSTPAYFESAAGRHYVFVTGSAKAAEDSAVSVAPGLARLEIVTTRGKPAYLRLDAAPRELVFQNPGSPAVSSNGHRHGIVWVLDVNKPRSASLYGADAPQPVLYAVDAETLEPLWRSDPGLLHASGKYNEPVIANGTVFVGTDRIQAFGLRRR